MSKQPEVELGHWSLPATSEHLNGLKHITVQELTALMSTKEFKESLQKSFERNSPIPLHIPLRNR